MRGTGTLLEVDTDPPAAPFFCYIVFVHLKHATMYDELWSEIQDMPGEIFDIPELNDEEFNMNEYLAADYDY